MKRRVFLNLACSIIAVAAMPVLAQPAIPHVVLFTANDMQAIEVHLQAFREGMRQRGYVEGRNFTLEILSGQHSKELMDRLGPEIVAKRPAVVVTQGGTIRSLAKLTKTIPLVAGYSGDLVEVGIVASLAHPGGNVTGMQFLAIELVGKRIELLKALVPRLTRIAVIADPGHAEQRERAASQAAADKLGIRMDYYPVRNFAELETGLEAARSGGAQALVVFPDAVTFPRRQQIADFALAHRLPAVSGWDAYAEAGMLLMYGPNLRASWSRLAYYVDRILKGANPADLPIEIPTTVEMIVNLQTAKALGIKVPRSFLLRADRVIE